MGRPSIAVALYLQRLAELARLQVLAACVVTALAPGWASSQVTQYLPACKQGGGAALCTPIRDNGWTYTVSFSGDPYYSIGYKAETPDLAGALAGFTGGMNQAYQNFCAAAGCTPVPQITGNSCAGTPTYLSGYFSGDGAFDSIVLCGCYFSGWPPGFVEAFAKTKPYCGPNARLVSSETTGCSDPSYRCGSGRCPNEPYACGHLNEPKDLGPPACGVGVGNPINAATGNKFQSESDYAGPGQLPLAFARSYNSFDVGLPGPMGYYWRSNFQRSIEFWGSGPVPMALAYRADGRVLGFKLISGAFVGDPDVADRLFRDVDTGGNVVKWRYVDAADITEEYTPGGRLTSITHRSGLTLGMSYDAAGNLIAVTDAHGRSLVFAYDSFNRIAAMTDPLGGVYSYSYDGRNRLERVTYPGGVSRLYHYDEQAYTANVLQPHALTGITDENGSRFAVFRYDATGKAVASAHYSAPGTEVNGVQVTYGASSIVVDSRGTDRTMSFQTLFGSRKCTGTTQPSASEFGNRKLVTYDAASGWPASVVDFRDVTTTFVRGDPHGRPDLETQRREALGRPEMRLVTTHWHPTFRLPTQVAEPAPGGASTTTLAYDGSGNLTSRTIVAPKNDGTGDTVSRTWSWTYGSLGRVLTATDPNGRVTTYSYYADNDPDLGKRGNLQSVTNPLGHVTQTTAYDLVGRPLASIDPNGLTTLLTYDARGRLTNRSVGSEQTSYTYDGVGQLTGLVLPDDSTLVFNYDAAHRLVGMQDGLGARIVYTLDASGNRVQEQTFDLGGTLARTRSRAFDALNRHTQDLGAEGQITTYGYDLGGNRTVVSDPLAHTTTNSYDALNRVTQVFDPAGGVTGYAYDAGGHVAQVIDPRGLATDLTYDGLGRLTRQVSPDTGATVYAYDASGNLATRIDARSAAASYVVDAMNRVTTAVYSRAGTPSETHTYTYDAGVNGKGRLTQVTDPSATTSWTYTQHGRVATKTQLVGGISRTVGYSYNIAGQLVRVDTPSGQQIGYSYANNRVVGVTVNALPLVSGIVTAPFGPAGAWQWGNGHFTFRDFDRDGRLYRWTYRNGADVLRNDLAFDAASRITAIADPVALARSGTYQYDALDRLIAAQIGTPVVRSYQFGYDAVGNRVSSTVDGATTTLTYGSTSNRLWAMVGAIDSNYMGGLSSATFDYDNANRLARVRSDGTAVAGYALNALGQRVSKDTGGSVTLFVYDEQGRLLGEYDSTGTLIQETVWLEDLPIATLRPTGPGMPTPITIFYVHADHLGTPRAITRPSDNALLWRWDSAEPFGNNAADDNPAGLGAFRYGLRFPGQYYDAETGMHYNYFRDYDPAIGRYVESDPVGLRGGINTYAYSGSSPLWNLDPLGLAYFAKRPLSHMPWLGYMSCQDGGIDDRLNTEVSHEHLFFEDGKSPPNVGHGPGGLFTERNPQGYRCKSGHYDDCVMRKAVANTPPRPYCILGKPGVPKYNCQDWAEDVRREYARLMGLGPDKCGCQ